MQVSLRFRGACIPCAAFLLGSAGCSSHPAPDSPLPDTGGADVLAPDVSHEDARTPKAPRCRESDAGIDDDSGSIPDTFPPSDAGDASDASKIGPVQVVSSGGPVLHSPRIVPITFDDDPHRDDLEDFVASVGCTPYWHAIAAEYGVGDAIGRPPVHVAEKAPSSANERNMGKWVRKHVEDPSANWPAPVKDVIYAIFMPRYASSYGDCLVFGGYHSSVVLASGVDVPYLVMLDCHSDLDWITTGASHELIEAATDPYPTSTRTKPAYLTTDSDHVIYAQLLLGGEVGDLCEHEIFANIFQADYPFKVQRTWSNAAAQKRHDPCVPSIIGAYVNTVPELPDRFDFSGVTTRGVQMNVGETRTIFVELFDEKHGGYWKLDVREVALPTLGHLGLKLDQSSGKSGDRIGLAITRSSEGASGFEAFTVVSTIGARSYNSFGLVTGR